MAETDEIKILRLAVRALSKQLDTLLIDCTDLIHGDQLKAPSRKVYMQSRACLPPGHLMALTKEVPK